MPGSHTHAPGVSADPDFGVLCKARHDAYPLPSLVSPFFEFFSVCVYGVRV